MARVGPQCWWGGLNFSVYENASDGRQFYKDGLTDGDDETKQSRFAVLRTRLKRRHFHDNNGYASTPACTVRASPCLLCPPIYLLTFPAVSPLMFQLMYVINTLGR